MRMFQDVGIGK